jgi:predicted phage-related endonuclease
MEKLVNLGDRTKYLGASDLGDVFQIEPYGCRRKLWYKKTGTEPDYPDGDNFNFRRGHRLEPLGASLYAQETGQKIRRRNQIIVDDKYGWMGCHLDREIVKDDRGPGVLEVKSPTMRVFLDVKRKGANEAYVLQLQQMLNLRKALWGAYAFYSAELDDLFHFEVLRDDELIAKIVEGSVAFWELVKRHEAPEKLEKKDKRCMRCNYQHSCQGITPEEYLAFVDPGEGIEIVFDEELERYAEERWSIKEIRDEANEMYDAVNDKIRLRMEAIGSEKVQVGRSKVYFTTVTTNRLDRKLLKAKMPDVYKEFVKPSSSKRLMLYKTK